MSDNESAPEDTKRKRGRLSKGGSDVKVSSFSLKTRSWLNPSQFNSFSSTNFKTKRLNDALERSLFVRDNPDFSN